MTGYPQASGPGGAQPLPPAFTQQDRPQGARTDTEQPQRPFFGGAAPAQPITSALDRPVGPRPGVPGVPPAPATPGGLPPEAIFMPDSEIPKKTERAVDYAEPVRRPVAHSDGTTLAAARLEMLARRLREQGPGALQAGFAGDPLDAALSGVVALYLAGRGG